MLIFAPKFTTMKEDIEYTIADVLDKMREIAKKQSEISRKIDDILSRICK